MTAKLTPAQLNAQANDTQKYLDALYALDGRNDPEHPMHSLYTGLAQQRIAALKAADRETLLGLAKTNDDHDIPLHVLLSGYIGPGLVTDDAACAAVTSAFCRILSSRLNLAVRQLDHPPSERHTAAAESVLAISDWLLHEAVRADIQAPAAIDTSPACVEAI